MIKRRFESSIAKNKATKNADSAINKIQTCTAIAAHIVTALAGAGAFFLYLWTVHTGYVKERDVLFSRNWINFAEGCIDCPIDENKELIKLNIDASNGEISGEIYIDDPFGEENGKSLNKKTSEELRTEIMKSYTNWFMVEGELSFHGGTVKFFDYREGRKQYFGKARIKLKNNSLYFEIINRAYRTIPLQVVFSEAISEEKPSASTK